MRKNKILSLGIILLLLFTFSCDLLGLNPGDDSDTDTDTGTPNNPLPFNGISAAELVADIKIGWNLGNTLDAWNDGDPTGATGWSWLASGVYANTSPAQMETAWIAGGNVSRVTTEANIKAIADAGFNAIRIPVTWFKAAGPAPNYTIRTDWMNRVQQVVDWALKYDMYVILNTHHDEVIFKFTDAEINTSLAAFRKIWEQIAEKFKNYDEKLIFEGLNEPRVKGSPQEWNGGTPAERANLNKYYPVFIDVVRNSGGNNDKRILMITTYAASPVQAAVDGLVLPQDTIADKLVVSIHFYEPYNFALRTPWNHAEAVNTWSAGNSSDTNPITQRLNRLKTAFVDKGIPVIIGEMGALCRNNEPARAAWATYYVTEAKNRGMPVFWWDNASTTGDGERFGLLNRTNNTFTYTQIRNALINASK